MNMAPKPAIKFILLVERSFVLTSHLESKKERISKIRTNI
jgi:hypothetical protein